MACSAPTVTVGGVTISTDDFTNAQELINKVSGDLGDPTHDEYNDNIADGNNTKGTKGIQFPAPIQTTLPGPITQTPSATVDTPTVSKNGVSVTGAGWSGNYDMQLSPNFKVRDFTIGPGIVFPHQLQDFNATYTAAVRCNNLQGVAVNIAENVFTKFGKFRINSGIRNENSVKNGLSQHVTGQAIDIQFPGWTYEQYWNNAPWIKDNIPYDQFIFEHSSTTGLAWYHLSFNLSGNRAGSDRTKVMTMYRNLYNPGLQRHG